MAYDILLGNCLEQLATLPDHSFDAVLTDPPYALTDNRDYRRASPSKTQRKKIERGGFLGCKWDSQIPGPEVWRQIARVCKSAAFMLAFGSPTTFHRLAVV